MPQRKISHCHHVIAKIARELAAATYEELMSSSNEVFETWKKQTPGLNDKRRQQLFVNRKWGMFIEAARATLTLQLRQPIDEATGDKIVEILALDATLIRGRKNPAIVAGELIKPN